MYATSQVPFSDCFKARRLPGKGMLFLSLVIFLASCLEVKQRIDINRDGSGHASLEIAVQREWVPMVIPKLKADAPRGWIISDEKETGGKHVIVFTRKFRDLSELSDNEVKYRFFSERIGFLKKKYSLEALQLKSSDVPFPYEVSIRLPGTIEETNGARVSSNEVRWDLNGLRAGARLAVRASGHGLPEFKAVSDWFERLLGAIFLHEVIAFLREDGVWIMDSDGRNQRRSAPTGIGHFSLSRNGVMAFDKFSPLSKEPGMNDLNVYSWVLGNEAKVEQHTSDGKSWDPHVSPDGSRIVYQKFLWSGEGYMGQGEGLWTINLNDATQGELAGVVRIPDDIRSRRNELFLRFGKGEMDDRKWLRDEWITWSSDGRNLMFERLYTSGGLITYAIDMDKGGRPQAPPDKYNPGGVDICDMKLLHKDNALTYTLVTYDLRKGNPQVLAKDVFVEEAQFAPGCKLVAFVVGERGERNGLWIVKSDGGEARRILSATPKNISWNHDGTRILFSGSSPGNTRYDAFLGRQVAVSEVWTIDANGSNPKKLATDARAVGWTLAPRLAAVSVRTGKMIVLGATALVSVLALITTLAVGKKAIGGVRRKRKRVGRGVFCGQCDHENAPTGSFCTHCGEKLR